MNTHRYYYTEQEKYPISQIEKEIGTSFLNELLKKSICCEVSRGQFISFEYVGILSYKGNLLCVFPKHYKLSDMSGFEITEMTILLKVLKKYSSTSSVLGDGYYLSNDTMKESNVVALADYILNDYSKYGYYYKEEDTLLLNGEGETHWVKTLEEIDPYFYNRTPIYFDTFAISYSVLTDNIIVNIHKYLVFFCNIYFGDLLDYQLSDVDSSIQDINDLGAIDELIGLVERELSIIFNDQKCNQLRAVIAFLKNYINLENDLILYGTRTFENVWEKVCGFVMKNEYSYYEDFIPKPVWTIYPNNTPLEKSTYIPDIIRTTKDLRENIFFILDAKYYSIKYEDGKLSNNPGVGDVSKQLLYEKALEKWTNHFKRKFNVFLFPAVQDKRFVTFGYVNLEFMQMDPVHLVYVSSKAFFEMYLNGTVLTDEVMNSFAKEIESQYSMLKVPQQKVVKIE